MGIKARLTLMSFMQFFVWGAWLITIGTYCLNAKAWTFPQFGAIFSTLALSSLFMPPLVGIAADRFISAEKLYGMLHLAYAGFLSIIPWIDSPDTLYWVIFGAMICYMPTISLSNSIAYHNLKREKLDVVACFPPIRVWGTVGFIAAMWVTNLTGSKANANQFLIAAGGAVALGIFAFFLPPSVPESKGVKSESLLEQLGLQAFKLFASYQMAVFFVFSMLLGAALQLTNMYGDSYLDHFSKYPEYADSVIVKYSTIVMSISQISETLFILTIPFFLSRLGIKKVMLLSMVAWSLRFGLFAWGNPAGGLWMIVLSCVVYGMAFDFFNISGSLFVETSTDSKIRSSAQGLFMMMTNGFGAYLGSVVSGWLIGRFFILPSGETDWKNTWLVFAAYALVVAVLFAILFRPKEQPQPAS